MNKLEQLLQTYPDSELELFAFFAEQEAKEHRKRMKKENK